MKELFKRNYETFDKPEIFWVFNNQLKKHYIYGYRKHNHNWYIKVKSLRTPLGESKGKLTYEWVQVKPNNVNKEKKWAVKMAIYKKIGRFDRKIKELEQQLIDIPLKIKELNKMKSLVSEEQFHWNEDYSIDKNNEREVTPIRIEDNVQKFFHSYSYLNY